MAAKAPVIGSIGARVDLLIKQGSDYRPIATLRDGVTGLPIDVTDCTIRAQIRRRALDPDVVATFLVESVDAPNGSVRFSLTAVETAAIVTDELLERPGSKFYWDMEMVDSAGLTMPVMYGDVSVFREVTR